MGATLKHWRKCPNCRRIAPVIKKEFQAHVPGCKGQDHRIPEWVGHLSQEQAPEELTAYPLDFILENN